ncbi:protein NRT1/ PTR FAMILY 5.6-like [Impatiens glandulifera]|uniref:protein NRT1/ PTR FAMILY 5.6-like n=1 Tax=Impatiens glandulifera TaxID=253017 RepID=UPI001FB0D0FB|nr:protein NRT1/ PTR FAMILY 5.6-like [Impatiens glandulifera]
MEKGKKKEEMMNYMVQDDEEREEEKWVYDSSLDHKGRLPSRNSTGTWKAALFIIVIEFSERLSYFGIATSLIIYLTKVIHQDLKTAAKNCNYWSGVTTLMPLLGGFLADSYLGRFYTVLLSSIVYLLGLTLLTLSRVVPSLKPCNENTDPSSCQDHSTKIHVIVFFISIYLISIGTGGHKPALESFGADQFDDDHPLERRHKMSFFNWWNFGLCCGLLFGVTVVVYVQDHFSWALADIILTSTMAFSLVIFIVGRPFYRYRKTKGSPLIPMLHVLVAAYKKRKLPYPENHNQLYEISKLPKEQGRLLCYTHRFKFLDKAAIMEEDNQQQQMNPWRLTTVTRVEELKQILSMIPIWLATLPFGICVAQTATFFVKQGATLDRKIGGGGFVMPAASVYAIVAIGMIVSVVIYDRILVPIMRRVTGNERGIKILKRIGVGMIFSMASMVVAALVESKRLNLVKKDGAKGASSMSVWWLAPQFLIMGLGDGFTIVGLQEYFYDQVPDSMRSLGIAFYLSVIGAGNFLSSILITVVDNLSKKSGGKSWFGKDLNNSRLDNFFWLLAGMSALNLCIYVPLANRYIYKSVQGRSGTVAMAVADCDE